MMSQSERNYRSSPFTAIQWQELELQALIYKYMVSGVQIPSDLIYSIKRSFDSLVSSRLFPHHPSGWGCFEMGFGKKADPEPGRCRRTDGKKWRCSKQAYPDSKYCERHMHRGRNRSRKLVEVSSNSTTSSTTTASISSSTMNFSTKSSAPMNYSASVSTVPSETHFNPYPFYDSAVHPFIHHHSSSSRPSGSSSHTMANPQLLLYSGSNKDNRGSGYIQGTKDERSFFPEGSGRARSLVEESSQAQPLTMSAYKSCSESLGTNYTKEEISVQENHCFVLGTDFKSQRSGPGTVKSVKENETQNPLHHFFEEWPLKNTDSWLDLSSNSNS